MTNPEPWPAHRQGMAMSFDRLLVEAGWRRPGRWSIAASIPFEHKRAMASYVKADGTPFLPAYAVGLDPAYEYWALGDLSLYSGPPPAGPWSYELGVTIPTGARSAADLVRGGDGHVKFTTGTFDPVARGSYTDGWLSLSASVRAPLGPNVDGLQAPVSLMAACRVGLTGVDGAGLALTASLLVQEGGHDEAESTSGESRTKNRARTLTAGLAWQHALDGTTDLTVTALVPVWEVSKHDSGSIRTGLAVSAAIRFAAQ